MSRRVRHLYLGAVVALTIVNVMVAALLAHSVAWSCTDCPPITCAAGDDGTCPGGCRCVAHEGVGQCEAR